MPNHLSLDSAVCGTACLFGHVRLSLEHRQGGLRTECLEVSSVRKVSSGRVRLQSFLLSTRAGPEASATGF